MHIFLEHVIISLHSLIRLSFAHVCVLVCSWRLSCALLVSGWMLNFAAWLVLLVLLAGIAVTGIVWCDRGGGRSLGFMFMFVSGEFGKEDLLMCCQILYFFMSRLNEIETGLFYGFALLLSPSSIFIYRSG